mmetsp:Transcript_14424/g.17728  ORF Transcript_14424/g.17728 Transcript_14424/m.17728 type:complete len:581 (-) Transcript_14424:16-1758(-)
MSSLNFSFLDGFPKPDASQEYEHEDVVWVGTKNMIFWPAIISCKTPFGNKTTSSDKKIFVKYIGRTEKELNNAIKKNAKMQDIVKMFLNRKLPKSERVYRSQILPYDVQATNDGRYLDGPDFCNEFVRRMGYENDDSIDDDIYEIWNEICLESAETLDQMCKMRRQEIARKESAKLKRKERNAKKQKMWQKYSGQNYDGRIEINNKKQGWILKAGDNIRYHPSGYIASDEAIKEIVTRITNIPDLFEIKWLSKDIPINVETKFNPPNWDTEIEKLPRKKQDEPIFFPLKQCQLICSKATDRIEELDLIGRQKFIDEMNETKLGSLINLNDHRLNNKKISKRNNHKNISNNNGKRKRRINDDNNDIICLLSPGPPKKKKRKNNKTKMMESRINKGKNLFESLINGQTSSNNSNNNYSYNGNISSDSINSDDSDIDLNNVGDFIRDLNQEITGTNNNKNSNGSSDDTYKFDDENIQNNNINHDKIGCGFNIKNNVQRIDMGSYDNPRTQIERIIQSNFNENKHQNSLCNNNNNNRNNQKMMEMIHDKKSKSRKKSRNKNKNKQPKIIGTQTVNDLIHSLESH